MDYLSDNLIDEIFNYTVRSNSILARCGLKILGHGGSNPFVILTELPDNPGMSVTNAIEQLAAQVHQQKLLNVNPEDIRWIERYVVPEETIDEVTFTVIDGQLIAPQWKRMKEFREPIVVQPLPESNDNLNTHVEDLRKKVIEAYGVKTENEIGKVTHTEDQPENGDTACQISNG